MLPQKTKKDKKEKKYKKHKLRKRGEYVASTDSKCLVDSLKSNHSSSSAGCLHKKYNKSELKNI